MCKPFTKSPTLRVVKACHLAALSALAICLAAGRRWPSKPTRRRPTRRRRSAEIFVPFKDLNILLENQPRRVLLSRQQYNELLKKAKITPSRQVPQAAVLTAADYIGESDGQRVRITGTLAIDVLEDGLQSLPLDLGGVGLLSAKLDDRDAAIGRATLRRAQPAGRRRGPPRAAAGNGGPAGDHGRPADAQLPPAAGRGRAIAR